MPRMENNNPFAEGGAAYARHRPQYPDALFAWLAAQAPRRVHALDIATGTGQAACALATQFDWVTAFDSSAEQLKAAPRMPNLRYEQAAAEAIPLADGCADLLVVAQALHWLDLDRFWPEARRVLRPGGVIATCTYNLMAVTPEVDALVHDLYHARVGRWWPAERRHVENGYAELAFPFDRLAPPDCAMTAHWEVERLLGYLRTWSAVKRCIAAGNEDPVTALEPALRAAWGDAAERGVRWPLTVLAGRC